MRKKEVKCIGCWALGMVMFSFVKPRYIQTILTERIVNITVIPAYMKYMNTGHTGMSCERHQEQQKGRD
jgi:hypothetical protein